MARVLHPDSLGSDWGITEELLAKIIEIIDLGNRQFVMANVKKGTRIPDPIRIPRPGELKKSRRTASANEIVELLGGSAVVHQGSAYKVEGE